MLPKKTSKLTSEKKLPQNYEWIQVNEMAIGKLWLYHF